MRKPTALFTIALALAAMILAPRGDARAQDPREGPTEINKCQTISQPGSYKLAGNLTFTGTGTCLPVTASNVTIDLDGFTISGPSVPEAGPNATAIVAADNTTGIAVRRGSISGFIDGVQLLGNGSIIEGLRVSKGVEVGILATGIVKDNTVVGIFGTPGQGYGIIATGIVTGNYVTNSRVANFEIGQGSTVIGNTAIGSVDPGFGFEVACPSNVTNNTAINNRSGNLALYGDGCNNTNNVAP